MPGIYVAAIITTALSLAILAPLILRKAPRRDWGLLVAAVLLTTPMCAVAFHLVRLPLHRGLAGLLGERPALLRFLGTFYAPLTEEPAKLWPLLILGFRRRVHAANAVRVAMALGLGFGIGEMWLLATLLVREPQIASLPWYSLSGYIAERFMVCATHGVFTATALRRLRKGFLWGLLGALFLHYLGNFPIYLAQINFGGLGQRGWALVLGLWVPAFLLALLGLLAYYCYGKFELGRLLCGYAKCPECGLVYARPLWLAVNLLNRRYERCPGCKRWHLTKRASDADAGASPPGE